MLFAGSSVFSNSFFSRVLFNRKLFNRKQAAVFTLTAALTLSLLPEGALQAEGRASLKPQVKAALDKDLTGLVGFSGTKVPGLAVIVYKDGVPVYSKFAGNRYIDPVQPAKNKPMTGDARFRIASVSKQFTAYTIMQLVDQKKIDLDADVSKYLGFRLRNPAYPKTPITARMLLSHTSSLRDDDEYTLAAPYSLESMFKPGWKFYDDGGHFGSEGAPGEYFVYTNLNYGVLGTMIEKVTGQRFDKYQRDHILKQLDIKGSYNLGDFNARDLDNLGVIYRKQSGGQWQEQGPWVAQIDDLQGAVQNPDRAGGYSLKYYKPGSNGTIFGPQGNLRISANELSHVLEMLINHGKYKGKQVIAPKLLDEMFKVQWKYSPALHNGDTENGSIEAYGLGVQPFYGTGTSRVSRDSSLNFQGHLGEAYGLLSGVLMRTGTKDGFVYIMNGVAFPEGGHRSDGNYSGNYVWEENLMDAVCRNVFTDKRGK
jgi:D-alanyl-D-alanine carboxypeptidase